MHLDIKGESVEKYMMLAELEVLSSISSCMDVVPTTHSLQSFTVSAICLLSRVFFLGGGRGSVSTPQTTTTWNLSVASSKA